MHPTGRPARCVGRKDRSPRPAGLGGAVKAVCKEWGRPAELSPAARPRGFMLIALLQQVLP